MTGLSVTRLKRIREIIDGHHSFRFCNPDDDPIEINAVTSGYRYLVTQLQRLAGPILDEPRAALLNSINVEYDHLYSAVDVRAEIDIIILYIEEVIALAVSQKDSSPAAAEQAFSTKSLEQLLQKRSMSEATMELKRCMDNFETDPPAAITAACSMLESVCKFYIEENNLEMPTKQTIRPLWKAVSTHLELDPVAVEDSDVKQILSGFTSIVEGIGSLRNHKSSAHGRGKLRYMVLPRHARLAIHASHTLVEYLLEKSERQNR